MVAGPLERANEIGFELSFDLIVFLLVFWSQLFMRDRFAAESVLGPEVLASLRRAFLGRMPNWSLNIALTCSILRTPGAEGSALGPVAYFASHAYFSASVPEAPVFASCPARIGLMLSGMYTHV